MLWLFYFFLQVYAITMSVSAHIIFGSSASEIKHTTEGIPINIPSPGITWVKQCRLPLPCAWKVRKVLSEAGHPWSNPLPLVLLLEMFVESITLVWTSAVIDYCKKRSSFSSNGAWAFWSGSLPPEKFAFQDPGLYRQGVHMYEQDVLLYEQESYSLPGAAEAQGAEHAAEAMLLTGDFLNSGQVG